MKKSIVLIFMIILIFINSRGVCDELPTEEIVVSASKIALPVQKIGKSLEIITKKEIEEKHIVSLVDLLKEIPSLDVIQNGGAGGNCSVFIRGANSEHTLILVDGIEINNPISPSRSGELSSITTESIQRIEILKGAQSTIYGSDAIGGVINIITKKKCSDSQNSYSFLSGSYNTITKQIAHSGSGKQYNYFVSASTSRIGGFSSADEKDNNSEKDGYRNFTITTNYNSTPHKNLKLNFIMKYINSQSDIDNFGGVGGDDINYILDSKQLYSKLETTILSNNEIWEQKLKLSFSKQSNNTLNNFDIFHPKDFSSGIYEGATSKFEWQNNFYLRNNVVTFGIDHEIESGNSYFHSESAFGPFTSNFSKRKKRETALYLQNKYSWKKKLDIIAGIRRDDYDDFGNKITYEISSSYWLNSKSRIMGNYGTGFKSPSLFQLYSSFGNGNLLPEESKSWDMGFESQINSNLSFNIDYFNNKFKNLIEFNSGTSKYVNSGDALSYGIETNLSLKFKKSNFKLSYVNMEPKNRDTGLTLLRRAKNKISLNIDHKFNKNENVNLDIIHIGNRDDFDYSSWPAVRIILDGYTLVNLGYTCKLRNNYQLIGRIDNLLNKEYEEVKGYGTSRRAYYLGIKRNW